MSGPGLCGLASLPAASGASWCFGSVAAACSAVVAWEVLQNLFAEEALIQVGIDFRRRDALVPQHHLYGSQVGAALQQVGGKGVAEGVWTDLLGDAGAQGVDFQVVEDRDAREVATASET